jgi:hypothetical protein
MAFLITEITLAQRDTPGFWRTLPCGWWHRMITLITMITMSHMLHSTKVEQEST